MTREFTKGVRAAFYAMLVFMGALFWGASMAGHFRMVPALYGDLASGIRPQLLALGMLVPSAVYLAALHINGRQRWTPYARLICGFLVASYFSAFIWSAHPATDGVFMVIVSLTLMVKACTLTYIDALELFRQWGWHEH